MKLETISIDPSTLWRPAAVARRLSVDAAMVTHWMDNDELDFVETADGSRMVPEESVVAFQAVWKGGRKRSSSTSEVAIEETTSLAD